MTSIDEDLVRMKLQDIIFDNEIKKDVAGVRI